MMNTNSHSFLIHFIPFDYVPRLLFIILCDRWKERERQFDGAAANKGQSTAAHPQRSTFATTKKELEVDTLGENALFDWFLRDLRFKKVERSDGSLSLHGVTHAGNRVLFWCAYATISYRKACRWKHICRRSRIKEYEFFTLRHSWCHMNAAIAKIRRHSSGGPFAFITELRNESCCVTTKLTFGVNVK